MNAWKEIVASKLSSLLADSSSRPLEPEIIPLTKEESHSSVSSYPSYVLSVLRTAGSSIGMGGRDKSTSCHSTSPDPSVGNGQDSKDMQKVSAMGDDNMGLQEKETQRIIPLLNVETSFALEEEYSTYDAENCISVLLHDSALISLELYEFLQASLPNMVKGCQWVLIYSTVKHGISLRTLLRRSSEFEGPCVLIVGDKHGTVFGALLDNAPRPTAKRKYQGTNQMFVFTTLYGEPRIFRATGANRYYYMCLNDLLAFGGGGSFALSLDDDLLHGTSGQCETYGNLCLAKDAEFELKNVELWGFRHMSRYIS